MEIRQAEPHQFVELCTLFQEALDASGNDLKRRLSYTLATGSSFISVKNDGQIEGAVCIDRDMLGSERVILIKASTKDSYASLLRKSMTYSTGTLFLAKPNSNPLLEEAASECGFIPCGEVTLGASEVIQLLSVITEPSP